MEPVDSVVIGAGVVGLAVARALALAGHEVIVRERATLLGSETSSRNTEVIHAGIYYPTGSLKARSCVAGKRALYAYLDERGLPYRRCGKLIVATSDDQRDQLAAIRAKAAANGVDDLVMLTADKAQELEPQLRCRAALLSPSTGILDSHALMLALQGDLEDAGGMIAFASPLTRAWPGDDGITLEVGGDSALRLRAKQVVNAAGLHAPALAHRFAGHDPAELPTGHFAKGNYYALTVGRPFARLIYPVPEAAGLGIHVTLDLAGQVRFGPDVEWLDGINYDVDPARADRFYAAIRTYWPALPDGALRPDYAGIRPKLGPRGTPASDFILHGPAEHGIPGLVHMFGIESPGLTAALALADEVVNRLNGG
ncbi:MAG: NAD(P)/FAD-dependent oxidoreductase [Geminicoccaceae bacterium]